MPDTPRDEWREGFRRGEAYAQIHSTKDAVVRFCQVGIPAVLAWNLPIAWYWRIGIILALPFVVGLIVAQYREGRRKGRPAVNIDGANPRGTEPDPGDLQAALLATIEANRRLEYGWNSEDAAKLEALWSSSRFPKPSVSFNDQGEVFVCPELARELEKPGNEGLTELLLSMGRQGAAIERRKLRDDEQSTPTSIEQSQPARG
jgi:hypothetical protein